MEVNTAAEWVTCVKHKRDELTEERKRERLKLEGMVREEQDKNQRHVGEGQSNEEERKRGGGRMRVFHINKLHRPQALSVRVCVS